jgi:hypothetical protein
MLSVLVLANIKGNCIDKGQLLYHVLCRKLIVAPLPISLENQTATNIIQN